MLYRVSAVASLLGVSTGWLRAKERAGLLPRVTRDSAGHRRFTAEDVARIRMVLLGRPLVDATKPDTPPSPEA